jgi:hypothetical protein
MLYFIKLIDEGADATALCENPKMSIICQAVRRKGLLSENFKVTIVGKTLLEFLGEQSTEVKLKKKEKTNDFEEWWKVYPGTDTFTYRDVSFTGTRTLRARREDCKVKLEAILAEGEYTIKEMIDALQYEVMQKKENSIKTKTNRMTFMQNSLTYLNQRTFEPFIELIKEGAKIVETTIIKGGTDI